MHDSAQRTRRPVFSGQTMTIVNNNTPYREPSAPSFAPRLPWPHSPRPISRPDHVQDLTATLWCRAECESPLAVYQGHTASVYRISRRPERVDEVEMRIRSANMMGPESKRLGEACSILSWSGGRARDPRIMREVQRLRSTEYRKYSTDMNSTVTTYSSRVLIESSR